MKKQLVILGLTAILAACASTPEINAARGKNSSRVTKAELDQYNKQRANEVIEAQSQAAKAEGYAEMIRQGSSAIQSGVDAVRSVLSIFGK